MIQVQAQAAGNGQVLFKGCNADVGHLACSHGARREAVVPRGHTIRGVAPLGKDAPLPARRALWPTASQLAEHINVTSLDH